MQATRELVRRKVRRYWPERVDQVISMLESSIVLIDGGERWEEERARVQLAVIKLAEGAHDELESCIEMARRDYRDVLAYAEYPEEMRTGVAAVGKLPPYEEKELRLMRARDCQQYEDWLMHDPEHRSPYQPEFALIAASAACGDVSSEPAMSFFSYRTTQALYSESKEDICSLVSRSGYV